MLNSYLSKRGSVARVAGVVLALSFGWVTSGHAQSQNQSASPATLGSMGSGGSMGMQSGAETSAAATPSPQQMETLKKRYVSPSGETEDDLRRLRTTQDVRPTSDQPSRDERRAQQQPHAQVPEEPNEFERFAARWVGKPLPVYGRSLFEGVPSTFAPLDRVPVASDYVVGPGDEILLRVWGQVDMDLKLAVDRNGNIFVPEVGNVGVAGVPYANLSAHLKKSLGRVFKNFDLNASLGQLRSIQVFVVGFAKRPGAYTVSSLSTMVNALFASGGPSARGSMRNIQVKRGNRVVSTLDLYDLIGKGDKTKDVQLLPGDVIYIPPVGRQVALNGSVNVAGIFEVREGETFGEVLKWSGGFTATAAPEEILFERVDARKARRVEIYDPNTAKGVVLADGDIVNVKSLVNRFANAVSLRGNVAQPRRVPWRDGMRVSDVITDRNMLITEAAWDQKNRLGGEFKTEKDPNKKADAEDVATGQKKLLEELRRNEGEVNWDYAVIERLNADLSTTLVPFNLAKAVQERDPSQDLLLKPGDIITVFSKKDIEVPVAAQTRYVRLEGEFARAGVYAAKPNETLRQLVTRVGGFTPDAYLYGAQLTRESARVTQQQKMDEVLNRLELEAERSARNTAGQALNPEDAASAKIHQEGLRAFVAKMRAVKASGRVVLELMPEAKGADALPDLPLEDGDRVYVSASPSVVNVLGAVYNPSTYIHKPGRTAADYLATAGGATTSADSKSAYLLRANGTVASKRQGGWLGGFESETVMPGDTVVVPEDLTLKTTWTKDVKDWTQILYQLFLGAAGLKAIK